MRRFVEVVTKESSDPGAKDLLENSLGRFKIWAGSIGLFALGRSGIDFRFRHDEVAREVITTMLEKLKRRLEPKDVDSSSISLPADVVRQLERTPPLPTSPTHSIDEFSLEEDSLGESSSDVVEPFPIKRTTLSNDLDHIIDLLYRFL